MTYQPLVALHQRFQAEDADRPALIKELLTLLSHSSTPALWPPDLNAADGMIMQVTEPGWRIAEGFVCHCGAPALNHPYTNEIWGCLACGYSTMSVAISFRRVSYAAPVSSREDQR